MVCGRRNVDNAILDQLKQIVAKSDVVETAQRRGAHLDDVSDDEAIAPNHSLWWKIGYKRCVRLDLRYGEVHWVWKHS